MGTVHSFDFTAGRLIPVTTDELEIGQRVMQAHKCETGTVCAKSERGYTVIFDDGSESDGQRLGANSPYTRIQVRDGIASGDEVNRLIQLRDAKRVTDRWEREQAAEQRKLDVERLTGELRAKYPWVKVNDPAKNIKAELGRIWPAVKFSVRRERGSGVSSIRIEWTDGPNGKQVEEVTGKYENGHFDGMTDSHCYDRSASGEAVDIVLGRVKYVFDNRHESDALIQKAIDRLTARYQFAEASQVTVAAFKSGALSGVSPFQNGGSDYHNSIQSLLHQEIAKIGMMPSQEVKA